MTARYTMDDVDVPIRALHEIQKMHSEALKILKGITSAQTKQIVRLQHQITELEITQRMLVEAQR